MAKNVEKLLGFLQQKKSLKLLQKREMLYLAILMEKSSEFS